eukprot:1392859-Amorphochlora_amoeboformis.AAC.2
MGYDLHRWSWAHIATPFHHLIPRISPVWIIRYPHIFEYISKNICRSTCPTQLALLTISHGRPPSLRSGLPHAPYLIPLKHQTGESINE